MSRVAVVPHPSQPPQAVMLNGRPLGPDMVDVRTHEDGSLRIRILPKLERLVRIDQALWAAGFKTVTVLP